VKYLYENGHKKFARKVEKLALKEMEKLNVKKRSKLESDFEKKVEEKKICIDKEKINIEKVTTKEEFSQFIEVKEKEKHENQIASLVKQESEVNEVLIVPPMDVCKSTIELVLFQRESSLVCNEENIHKTRLILDPWQKQMISHSPPNSIQEWYNWFLISSLKSITFPQLLKFLT
jgi:hypothetical protein